MTPKVFSLGLIIVFSTSLVAGIAFDTAERADERNQALRAAQQYTPPDATFPPLEDPHPVVTTNVSVPEAVERLRDIDRQWTMTVLSDSTGNEPTEWVRLMIKRLADETGRPAIVHNWANTNDGTDYATETKIAGEGAPIVVWNGSVPGNTAGESLQQIDVMAPEKSDLVIISHGHNQSNADQALVEVSNLISWAQSAWDEQPAVAIALQNPSIKKNVGRQEANVSALRRQWSEAPEVTFIDAWTAFKKAGDLKPLLRSDGFHPSESGSKLWADAAWEALSFNSILT